MTIHTILITTVMRISENVSEAAQTAVRHGKASTFFYNFYVRSFK